AITAGIGSACASATDAANPPVHLHSPESSGPSGAFWRPGAGIPPDRARRDPCASAPVPTDSDCLTAPPSSLWARGGPGMHRDASPLATVGHLRLRQVGRSKPCA